MARSQHRSQHWSLPQFLKQRVSRRWSGLSLPAELLVLVVHGIVCTGHGSDASDLPLKRPLRNVKTLVTSSSLTMVIITMKCNNKALTPICRNLVTTSLHLLPWMMLERISHQTLKLHLHLPPRWSRHLWPPKYLQAVIAVVPLLNKPGLHPENSIAIITWSVTNKSTLDG